MPVAREQVEESFDALAGRVLPGLIDEVVAGLRAVGPDALPHEVKPLRKLLGKLRDHLDLFAPVFPLAPDWRDRWAELRAAVDQGYGVFGAFKDLYDTQGVPGPEDAKYDPAQVATRRAAALGWRDRFLRARGLRSLTPHPGARKRTGLSPRFWGAPGPRPDRERSGLDNVAHLVRYRLREARRAWRRAAEQPHLDGKRARERFHDARKRARACVRLLEWFPEIGRGVDVARLDELVVRQGKILDRLNAEDAAGAAAEWSKLRRWARRRDVEQVMREVRRRVRR